MASIRKQVLVTMMHNFASLEIHWFHRSLSGKKSACSAGAAGDTGLIPGSGRSPGGGHGDPLQYSCLENPMDRGAWQATVHGVAKSQTQLSDLAHIYEEL